MTFGDFMGMYGGIFIFYILMIGLGFWLSYLVIRTAVDHGMRRFTQWQRDQAIGGVKLK